MWSHLHPTQNLQRRQHQTGGLSTCTQINRALSNKGNKWPRFQQRVPPRFHITGFPFGRYPWACEPDAEPRPWGEPGRGWSSEEPGVQRPEKQAGGSELWRHSEGPAATKGDGFYRDPETNYWYGNFFNGPGPSKYWVQSVA